MNIVIAILLSLAGIIVLLLVIGLFLKKEHYVRCEIIINAPRQKVFDYLKMLKNQENFNKNAMADPGRVGESKGTDGTVGFLYAWSGNKDAGEGEKEIMGIVEGKKIEMQIRFVKPMRAIGNMVMETESLTGNQTKVYWSNGGPLPYPFNIMVPMVEKSVSKDMNISLLTLKGILER